ncbi:MAG: hypothetical protein ABIP94_19750 [Planctomycetota bacterium]
MNPIASRLDAMRASFRDLGPLRPIAIWVAVAPALGTLLLLSKLPIVVVLVGPASADPRIAFAASTLGLGLAIGTALLLPSAAAFAAGYCLGAETGAWAAVLGVALGSVAAQQVVAPRLPAGLFPFMRDRPRAAAVQSLCRGGVIAAALGVARVRWAARMPLAVTNLLFAVVAVPKRSVLLGSMFGALPSALLAAVAGDAFRTWRERGQLPGSRSLVVAVAALLGALCLWHASRRAWRAARGSTAAPSTRADLTWH